MSRRGRATHRVFGSSGGPDSVWTALSGIAVAKPTSFSGVGDGSTDDTTPLNNTSNSLTSGGIVYLDPTKTYRKTNVWSITQNHVYLWSPHAAFSGATPTNVFADGTTAGGGSKCAIRWNGRTNGGMVGVKMVGDADANPANRMFTFEDNGVSVLSTTGFEMIGCEIAKTRATGMTLSGSTLSYTHGNYVHEQYGDHLMCAFASDTDRYVWRNFMYRGGDDGVSTVTNLNQSPRIRNEEIWLNTVIEGNARGISVIGGGPNINIHHNWCVKTRAAGIIFASEAAYNTEEVDGAAFTENNVVNCCIANTYWGQGAVGHPHILVSGLNGAAGAMANIVGGTNRSVTAPGGGNYSTNGNIGANVVQGTLQTSAVNLPSATPTIANAAIEDTSVLKMRDVSFVSSGNRPGLYRIHVRTPDNGSTFQQRFEYVVKGSPSDVASHITTRLLAGDYVSEFRDVTGTRYALYLTGTPHTLGTGVSAATFTDLRAGDNNTTLTWLWGRVDTGVYT